MAALTLRFHERLVASNQAAELRISINGESNGEWVKLAAWLEGKGLLNLSNIQWMIQACLSCLFAADVDICDVRSLVAAGPQALQGPPRSWLGQELWR